MKVEQEDLLLNEKEVAKLVGLTNRAFQQMRLQNRGPVYFRISSRCIRYSKLAILKWLTERKVTPSGGKKKK